jgi:hypothetical protein
VGEVSGMSLDEEFGPGTSDITKCIKRRHQVKMVVQINQFCTAPATPESCAASLPKYSLTGVSATDQIIDGMLYTTAGLTSITDFQARGYQYIQP